MSALYGISALYHRPTWTPERRRLMQRLDHSAIFLLIAGTYTPVFTLMQDPQRGWWPLVTVWIGAGLGVAKSLLWAHAPKPVTAAVCLIVGWAAVRDVIPLAGAMGPTALWLLVAGGVIYSVGAVVYAIRRPDPLPRIFGYHEIFHVLVIVASVVNFLHVVTVVSLAG
jgi:hemolysin III